MAVHPPPYDAFLAIYWTLRDVRVALAQRLPEFAELDVMQLIEEDLSDERIGYTTEEIEELASTIAGPVGDVSVSRGWDAIEDSLNFHLGFPSLPDDG
jgi:hypothetical protein